MTFRPILALAVAGAALALPAAALAEDGPKPPPCGAAPRAEGEPSPCAVRVCNDGQATTPEVPCLAPCAPGARPTREAPCAPVPATQPPKADGPQRQPEQPRQGDGAGGKGFGFVRNRVWRLAGEADGFDADRHALRLVVDAVTGLPPRLADRLEAALRVQADVLVGARTRVLDAAGHR